MPRLSRRWIATVLAVLLTAGCLASGSNPDFSYQVTGEVRNLPYRIASGTFVRQPGEQTSPGGEGMPNLVGGGLLCIFGLLILANFVFQFTVGARVYAGQRFVWLRSLRGTPTFIRGWQNPDLRRLMILWSILLGVLGLLIAGLLLLSLPYN
ncbi:MAG: hypothetical protein U5K99_03845 [Anaerolineales bacterium]|nr:hypothetical protein [Anaerolineales bacterium]